MFLVQRISHSIVVLFGLSVLVFIISNVMPGDPARIQLGNFASERQVERLREKMHLDKPLYVRYYHWLKGALHGDFGESLTTERSVVKDLVAFLPATLELMLFALLLQVILGQTIGIISAHYSNTWIDNTARVAAYAGVVIPPYVLAIFLLLLFGFIINLFPHVGRLSETVTRPPVITGMITIDGLLTGHFSAVGDAVKHLILPGLSLAMAGLCQQARMTRISILNNKNSSYVEMARISGFPKKVILLKYLLKPSLIPTVSLMGLDFAAMLSNAFLVEVIYDWRGFSQYGMMAMLRKDLNAITLVVMVIGTVYIIMNIIVDIALAYLDPRTRLKEKTW